MAKCALPGTACSAGPEGKGSCLPIPGTSFNFNLMRSVALRTPPFRTAAIVLAIAIFYLTSLTVYISSASNNSEGHARSTCDSTDSAGKIPFASKRNCEHPKISGLRTHLGAPSLAQVSHHSLAARCPDIQHNHGTICCTLMRFEHTAMQQNSTVTALHRLSERETR